MDRVWYSPLWFSKAGHFGHEVFWKMLFGKKKETKKLFSELWYYSSLSFSIALSVVIGLGIGYWLDNRVFQTSPWFTLIFLGLGIVAGFRNIYLAMKKSQKS
jgi:ATP synthase protein I